MLLVLLLSGECNTWPGDDGMGGVWVSRKIDRCRSRLSAKAAGRRQARTLQENQTGYATVVMTTLLRRKLAGRLTDREQAAQKDEKNDGTAGGPVDRGSAASFNK